MTRDEIRQKFTNLLLDQEFGGEVANITADLLTESYITAIPYFTALVNESSLTKSIYLSSKIQGASDLFYSVFRGRNQRVTLSKLTPIKSFSVKKYDLLETINGINLYYANDYEFLDDIDTTVDFIVGENLITINNLFSSQLVLNIPNTYSNLSEDISITLEGVEIPLVKRMDQQTDDNLLSITKVDYRVSFYKTTRFDISTIYNVLGIEYTEKTLVEDDFSDRDFQGFVGEFTVTLIDREQRQEDLDEIPYLALKHHQDQFKIRSVNDIEEIFSQFFSSQVLGSYISITPSFVTICYLSTTGQPLDPDKLEEFRTLSKSYLISQEIVFTQPEEITLNFTLRIKKSGSVSHNEVLNIIKSYENRVGQNFYPNELVSDLSRLSGVDFVDIPPEELLEKGLYPFVTVGSQQKIKYLGEPTYV